ncbi:MAG: hypothetical protein H7175_06005 [Burkholderiales bacterium]|nr:hypothetical protein [Anaerolineae bacterium]
MKALSLIFASLILISGPAYAEKAPIQPRVTKVSPRIVRVRPPVRPVAPTLVPKSATDAEIIKALNNGTQLQSTDTARVVNPNQNPTGWATFPNSRITEADTNTVGTLKANIPKGLTSRSPDEEISISSVDSRRCMSPLCGGSFISEPNSTNLSLSGVDGVVGPETYAVKAPPQNPPDPVSN